MLKIKSGGTEIDIPAEGVTKLTFHYESEESKTVHVENWALIENVKRNDLQFRDLKTKEILVL